MAFIEGDEFHRIHSGSKGGKDSVNSGPLIDLAMLSEAPVRRRFFFLREEGGWWGGDMIDGKVRAWPITDVTPAVLLSLSLPLSISFSGCSLALT